MIPSNKLIDTYLMRRVNYRDESGVCLLINLFKTANYYENVHTPPYVHNSSTEKTSLLESRIKLIEANAS